MPRRIPSSKKHKKVKSVDPFYTGDRKKLLDRSAGNADRPPTDSSVQEIPRKLKELMDLKEKTKRGEFEKSKKKKQLKLEAVAMAGEFLGEYQPGMKKPLKPLPDFKRQKGENDSQYIHRISSIAQEVIDKSKVESKMDVDFIEKPDGEVDVVKRKDVFLEEELRLPLQMDGETQKRKSDKKFRRRMKEKLEKTKKNEDKIDEFEQLKDVVSFGEVVTEPPNLQFSKKKSDRKNLILDSIFNATTSSESEKISLTDAVKRKRLEEERQRVVNEYKRIKKQNKIGR